MLHIVVVTRMLALLLAAITLTQPDPARFAVRNLRTLRLDAQSVLGADFIARVDSARLTLMCVTCTGAPAIDVLLGRQTDGTEERVRAGTTTFARLDSLCHARNSSCHVEGLRVGPGVGWISSYRLGAQSANTVIVLRGGDLLTIRAVASDSATARRHADRLIETLVPMIVGR